MRKQGGRGSWAWSTGWRALRLHVAAFALAGGLAGLVLAFWIGYFWAPLLLMAGLCAGSVAGFAPAAVHGVAQGVLAYAVPPDRSRPAAPLLATVVSLTVGLLTLVTVSVVLPDDRAAMAYWLAGATVYVLATWPLTQRVYERRR